MREFRPTTITYVDNTGLYRTLHYQTHVTTSFVGAWENARKYINRVTDNGGSLVSVIILDNKSMLSFTQSDIPIKE